MSELDAPTVKSERKEHEASPAFDASTKLLIDAFKDIYSTCFPQRQNDTERQLGQSERAEARPEQAAATPGKRRDEWTVVVQLDTMGPDSTSKLEQLKKLAEQTKGQSVTIIAQCADIDHTDDPNRKLERYEIRDGQVTRLKDAISKGLAQDTQDLLSFTGKNYPSDKIGLILHTHGSGNIGVHGGTDRVVPIQQLAKSIEAGLAGTGHTQLDLIDFDACVMGQNGVLANLKNVAKHVVASEQAEDFAPKPGQDIFHPLEALLKNPKMDGGKLADKFVDAAKDEGDREGERTPIKTLAHFDLSAYPRFQRALDDLGSQLIKAMEKKENRHVIEEIIRKTRDMKESNDAAPGEHVSFNSKRDIKDFTNKLLSAIKDGKLKADPELETAVKGVIKAQADLVKSFYGEGDSKGFGGLTAYLPERATLDVERRAAWATPVGRLCKLTSTPAQKLESTADRKTLLARLETDLSISKNEAQDHKTTDGLRGTDSETTRVLKLMEEQTKTLRENLNDPKKFSEALQELHKTATELSETPYFRAYRRDMRQSIASSLGGELISGGSWQRFRERLLDHLSLQLPTLEIK